jgi:hypothetical protein
MGRPPGWTPVAVSGAEEMPGEPDPNAVRSRVRRSADERTPARTILPACRST